ncbi:DUF262 domain-containing protein [Empedobacter sp. R132-2]|uniref:DUF262 domain-containing protein n=1 Tax=Empedobacter sp. R132-2 TaxID=2746740 RepID=UPI0025783416|nr:DUF262 domain-containing protein [Empedobacter sp. R132-2]MDM1137817.1 DUF262 domain-containing protein [Empedobacter sp. R132-2]
MSTILPFEKLFEQTIFRIPDYQRGYSWTEKELNDLWADLSNTSLRNDAYHFTGILTVNTFSDNDFNKINQEGFNLVENPEGKKTIIINGIDIKAYNLVDGQQRLTTILILLSRLVKKINNVAEQLQYSRKYFFINENEINKYIFGYHVDVPSHNFLIRDIFEDPSYNEESTETLYTHNLLFAKNYFDNKINNFSPNEINELITKITKRLLFSILDLSVSVDTNLDVSMIFETLNFRGKQLSGLERFKNRVLYLLSKQPFNQAQINGRRTLVNNTWLEVYKWLGRNQKKPMVDDNFLKAFWLLYFSNETMVAKNFKAYQYNLFEHDFSLMNITENNFMNPYELGRWTRAMKRAVRLWYFINNPYAVDDDPDFDYIYTKKIQRSLLRLNSFPYGYGSYMLNLVLAVLSKKLPQKNDDGILTEQEEINLTRVEKILWTMERHNIMCFLLNGNKTNYNQETTFRDINRYFRTEGTAYGISLSELLKESRTSQFSWNNVSRNILQNQNFYSWDGIHFILREYEEIISDKRVDSDISLNLLYPNEEYHSVRIFYQDINSLTINNRVKYTYSLGNIFISSNKQNPKSFQEHKDRIKASLNRDSIVYDSEIELLSMDHWTKETVIIRGKKILNAILDKWEIPHPTKENLYDSLFGHQ